MLSIPQTSLKAERFHSYVEELRQFASTYGMHCGDPDDLHGFAAGLEGDESFRDECSSMLRSIVYRERGKAPPSELLALAAVAWGGPTIEGAAEGLQEPIRRILRFVSGVMNPPRASAPASRDPDVTPFIVEPAVTIEAVPKRTVWKVGMSAGQGAAFDDAPPRPQAADMNREITSLERDSADVIRYLALLRQRVGAEEMRSQPTVERPLPHLALPGKLLSTPAVALPIQEEEGAEEGASSQYDPWDERSELQQELRRFGAEREARLAAERAAKRARTPQARLLRKIEAVLSRLVGAITS